MYIMAVVIEVVCALFFVNMLVVLWSICLESLLSG